MIEMVVAEGLLKGASESIVVGISKHTDVVMVRKDGTDDRFAVVAHFQSIEEWSDVMTMLVGALTNRLYIMEGGK